MEIIKVICIDKSPVDQCYNIPLIEGKIYDAKENLYYWEIINEKQKMYSYSKTRFITLAEWRETQINSIFQDD